MYAGGKAGAGVFQNIINLMPPHTTYVEAFFGDGAIMRNKRPAHCSIGIDLDPAIQEKFLDAAFDNIQNFNVRIGDALEILPKLNLEKTALVYCDPPYLLEVRKSKSKIYNNEMMTEGYHRALLKVIKRLDCMVLISGYRSKLYDETLDGWRTHDFYTTNRAGHRVLETVWINYQEPLELHDYKFLGADFRERERIKRKRKRWKQKLESMPALERHALMATIEELKSFSGNRQI